MTGTWVEITVRGWVDWPDDEGEADEMANQIDSHLVASMNAAPGVADGSATLTQWNDDAGEPS